jgi:gamma-glutamyltranspeptidase/glutathione hydrolase
VHVGTTFLAIAVAAVNFTGGEFPELARSETAGAQDQTSTQGSGYDRPAHTPKGSRSEVIAPHGMVAASQPLAAQVGIDILKAGGNAIDAAVAVNAMLGLVEPHMNGIGGDLFAIVWNAEEQKLHALNGTGRSPYALSLEALRARDLDRIPGRGLVSWTVPGAVDAWTELLEHHGTMTLRQVLAPAIAYARDGFPVSEIIAGQWQDEEEALTEWPDSATTYLPDGRAPKKGEVFRNPNLARVYEAIANEGRDVFYHGSIADRIVAFSEANGGFFSKRDFEDHSSTWVDPISTSYRDHEVWELPPNSHGITALMMLNILEGYDFASLEHNSTATLHRMIEAKKLAFADRSHYVADPEFNALPVAELVSKPYGASRRAMLDATHAALTVMPGDPLEHGDTVYLSVVDKDRNVVSLIQSIFDYFGSRVVPGDLGFAMQNRGIGFSLEQGHLNVLEPHKRSLHTNMPGMVTKDGIPWLTFGVMGGNMQPQGHTQVLANLIDFGMSVQEAGDAARWRHMGQAPRAGEAPTGGTVLVESGISDEVVAQLEAMGHVIRRADGGAMGGYQAIMINPITGMLHGGTDPRKDGAAIGY